MGELMLYKYLKNLCATQVSSEKLKMTCLKPLQSRPALITPKAENNAFRVVWYVMKRCVYKSRDQGKYSD